MKKRWFIIVFALLFVLCGIPFLSNNLKVKANSENSVSFESFSNAVLDLLSNENFEKDYDKTIYTSELTTIDNASLIDADTFCKITNSKLKLSAGSCEIQREEKNVIINADDNNLLVDDINVIVIPNTPKMQNNKMYFSLTDIAKCLGYEVFEKQDKIVLSNPYQTKRLIVSSSQNLDSMGAIKKVEGYKNLHIFKYKTEKECKDAFEYYESLSYVDYVEVDKIFSVKDTYFSSEDNTNFINTNNEKFSNNTVENKDDVSEYSLTKTTTPSTLSNSDYTTWGAKAMNVANYANYLMSLNSLKTVIIAVLDTGIDTDHPWFNNRIANGGTNKSNSKQDAGAEYEDVEGHGTHVSGTIVDLTLSNVKILPVKVMDDNGYGSTLNILNGILYVINLKKGEVSVSGVDKTYFQDIVAINISLGGSTYKYETYKTLFDDAYTNGIIPVVAAGNEGSDVKNTSPANVEKAITVSAVGKAGENNYYHPYWSNWGKGVDVCAPGEDILSAKIGGGTVSLDGTSMSAPHVSGMVALLYSSGSYSVTTGIDSVINIINNNAVDLGEVGKDNYFGMGLAYVGYAYANLLDDNIVFSKTETDITKSFSLVLTNSTLNSSIYYTLDGTEPNIENATLFTNYIPINKTCIVRARIVVLNGSNKVISFSKVFEKVYVLNNLDIDNAYTIVNGEITSYHGLLKNVIVPTEYKGIKITGVGEKAFVSANPISITLPSSVKAIGRLAFYGCYYLEKVTGVGVEKIGIYSFYYNQKLQKVTDSEFPEVTLIDKIAFMNCTSIKEVSLSKVTKVDYLAFCNNMGTSSSLLSVNLPNVEIIGDSAFYNANSLTQVNLPKVEFIGTKAFLGCAIEEINLPKAKYIGIQSFEANSNLTKVTMEELVFVGVQSFYNCKNLTTVNLPNVRTISSLGFAMSGVTSISFPLLDRVGVAGFSQCTGLTTINVPNLKFIKAEAFSNCARIESIDLPNVIIIEEQAFYNLGGLKSVKLSPCLEYFSMMAFNRFDPSCIFLIYKNTPVKKFVTEYKFVTGEPIQYQEVDEDVANYNYEIVDNQVYFKGFKKISRLEIIIPSFIGSLPVTKICDGAFTNNNYITNVVLPNVISIEENAFSGCSNLISVYANNLETIQSSAFKDCVKLSKVDIPNITQIEDFAFYNCPQLKEITINKDIIQIGTKALGYTTASTLVADFTMSGYSGVAENYATNNGITFNNIYKTLEDFYYVFYTNNGRKEMAITLVDSYIEGDIVIPETCKIKNETYTISKIADNAFENCYKITNIILPSTIKTLGNSAFYSCTNLRNINLNYVTSIGEMSFARCENLSKITLNEITDIKIQAFAFCYNLQEITMPKVTTIEEKGFYYCIGLETVNSPSLKIINRNAFANCYRLKNIDLNNITILGTKEEGASGNNIVFEGSVFQNCYELGEYVYLNSIEELGGTLFTGSSVKKIVIGKNFKFYSQLYNYQDDYIPIPPNRNITIYGYKNTLAQIYANKYSFEFIPLDEFSLTNKTELNITCKKNETCELEVEAKGLNLKYEWFVLKDGKEELIKDAVTNSLQIDTSKEGIEKYFVRVTNWDGQVATSQTFTVTVLADFEIIVENNEKFVGVISSVEGSSISAGQDVTYTFIVSEGYYIKSIYIDEIPLNATELQDAIKNGYTFYNISSNHTIRVEHATLSYTITVTYGKNGKVYSNNIAIANGMKIKVNYGTSKAFEAIPFENYQVRIIVDDTEEIKTGKYSFENIKENHTLQIFFDIKKYTITLSHNDFGLVETIEGLTDIEGGEDRTFRITVDEGFYVEKIKCDGKEVPVDDNTFTITNIHSDINIEITFSKIEEVVKEEEEKSYGSDESIIFVGAVAGILVVIFTPLLIFKRRRY